MLHSLLLLPLASLTPSQDSLLAIVPEDAYALVHCRDFAALRDRAERNDWYRLLASRHGQPFLAELARELHRETRSELDELLAMGERLEGEVVFFDTRKVAGFVTAPPTSTAELASLMRAWIPAGEGAARRKLELPGGGSVELVAWPDEIEGWAGRTGHFAAFVEHPRALAIYSADDSTALMAALEQGVERLGAEQRASVVTSYLEAGGGRSAGVELFVDFTPFFARAEAALAEAADSDLFDPTRLLGLEQGTWLHATADVFPGTPVDCQARLRLPPETLVSQLADTFEPLPHTLPAELPGGVWALWALNWDIPACYARARAAVGEAGHEAELGMVDGTLEFARGRTGVDPVVDVLNQLDGDFTFYMIDPPAGAEAGGMHEIPSMGLHAGLRDQDAFRIAFEKLIGVDGLDGIFTHEQISGVDAWLATEERGFDGGIAFPPRLFTVASSRRVMERLIGAQTGAGGASLLDGSRMQAAIDEHAGVCFLSCVEMTPLRAYMLPEVEGDLGLPPLEDGGATRDPFDSQLVSTARRTPEGFELRLRTR